MKKLLLFTSLLIGFTSFSQDPDPDLFQTWHLIEYHYEMSDHPVSGVNPPISPTITITNSLDFTGEGACNEYSGTFTHSENGSILIIENFNPTTETCEEPDHINFEDNYFEFFDTGHQLMYEIEDGNSGQQTLKLETPIFSGMSFSNRKLSTAENKQSTFNLYPNPATETLFITSENNLIEKIAVYSINGKLVLSEKENVNQLNVSSLSNGLYFVEITSENGTAIQKFMKQ